MRFTTLLIFALVATCSYQATAAESTLEKGKEAVKEKMEAGADMLKEKAEAAKDSVKEGAESIKDSVKETVQEWSDTARALWEKSGSAFDGATKSVRDGIKYLTPEFLQKKETEPALSKLQEWKTKASSSALKELHDAAALLEEANAQVKDIMTLGKVDAKAKMTRLRLSVDHAVRQATRAFKSLKDQSSREGIPQALSDQLKQGWTATSHAVDSLKEFVSNAYNKEEDKHEIVQDLEATFKQWDKFKASVGEKMEAAKESAMDAAHSAKETAMDSAHSAKETAMDAAHSAKESAEDKLQTAKATAGEKFQAAKDAAHAAKDSAGEKLQAAKDAASEKVQAAKDAIKEEL